MKFKIVNITTTFTVKQNLDLNKLENCFHNSKFQPKKFSALRVKSDYGSFLIFRNGFVVLTGLSKVKSSKASAAKLARNISFYLKEHCKVHNFSIRNLVVCSKINSTVNLHKLANNTATEWSPELFPGLHFKLAKGIATIFSTGNYFITGLNTVKDGYIAFKQVLNLLETRN